MTKTIRLTAAQAMVRYVAAQMNGNGEPFIAGCWAIFGHGNVAGIGEALYHVQDNLPTYRGQTNRRWRMLPLPMPSNWVVNGR